MDIVEFLTACVDEDERIAQAIDCKQWDTGWAHEPYVGGRGYTIRPHIGHVHEVEAAEHIVAQDPARTLRRVAAYRAILAMYSTGAQFSDFAGGYESAIDDALCTLASEFSDRPGFNPQWSLT